MKRRFLILLLMAVAVIGAKAQNTLNVYQKDGTLLCFSFADKPITLFVDDDVVVKTDKQILSFPFSSIDRYTFEDGLAPAGVLSIQSADSSSGSISIYDMSGRLLKTINPSSDSSAEIQTSDLPLGTYIIKSKNTTYKFQKK